MSQITWRNIGIPQFGSANQLLTAGADSVAQGLRGVAAQATAIADEERDANTARLIQEVNQANSSEGIASIDFGQFGSEVDQLALADATRQREQELFDRATQTRSEAFRERELAFRQEQHATAVAQADRLFQRNATQIQSGPQGSIYAITRGEDGDVSTNVLVRGRPTALQAAKTNQLIATQTKNSMLNGFIENSHLYQSAGTLSNAYLSAVSSYNNTEEGRLRPINTGPEDIARLNSTFETTGNLQGQEIFEVSINSTAPLNAARTQFENDIDQVQQQIYSTVGGKINFDIMVQEEGSNLSPEELRQHVNDTFRTTGVFQSVDYDDFLSRAANALKVSVGDLSPGVLSQGITLLATRNGSDVGFSESNVSEVFEYIRDLRSDFDLVNSVRSFANTVDQIEENANSRANEADRVYKVNVRRNRNERDAEGNRVTTQAPNYSQIYNIDEVNRASTNLLSLTDEQTARLQALQTRYEALLAKLNAAEARNRTFNFGPDGSVPIRIRDM